jgi:UDP-glucuronate decarboxylase
MYDGRVVSNFITQALKNEPITIYGKGNQTRSFCYVEDMIEGLVKLMNSQDSFTGPVNFGNPNEFTMKELAEKVLSITKSKSSFNFKALPEDDPKQRKPDINLAKKVLKWEPKIEWETGLTKTVEYFHKYLKGIWL